jgi:uncharacterized protein with GYD domain
MPQYILLGNWTDQGAREAAQTVQRSERFRSAVTELGGQVHGVFWTQGRYDIAARVEVADDETMAAIALRLAAMGSVHSETLRAFSAEEFTKVIERAGLAGGGT